MDDQQLIDEARKTQGYSEGDLRSLVRSLADALSAAVARNAELQEIFDGGYGEFEESIKDREAKRYRSAIGNWRAAALKAEAELASAAVRYRAEGWDEGYDAASGFYRGREKGRWEDDYPRKGMRQWIAYPAPVNPHRALLDENNETQEANDV